MRRARAVDLAIALVGENQKAEAPRQRGELLEVSAIGDRALRVRRRGDIERDGARQQRLVERIEVRQEAGLARGRQIHRLAVGADRAGGISGVKRIGNKHRRPPMAGLDPILGGECREKQSLAGAAEHQHFVCRIDRSRQLIAAAEPSGDGNAEFIEALVRGIAAEFRDVSGHDRPDERRNRMLRLADGETDRRLAGRRIANELARAHEGRPPIRRANRRGAGFGAKRNGGRLRGSSCTSRTAGPPAASPVP